MRILSLQVGKQKEENTLEVNPFLFFPLFLSRFMINSDTAGPSEGTSWETLKERGNQAFKSNSFDDAIEYYSKAIAIRPDEATLYSNRSACYLKKGAFEQASSDAQKAVEVDNCFVKAYSRLHNALCNLGRFEEAAQAMRSGIAVLSPSGKATPVELKNLRELQASAERAGRAMMSASERLQAGAAAEASQIIAASHREFPDSTALAFLYAEARAPASPEDAGKALSFFSFTHSSDPVYLYLRALVLYYRGQDGFANAQTILRQVLQLDPDNDRARLLLKRIRLIESHKDAGNTAFKGKQAKAAVEEYTSALECDPLNIRMNATLRGNRAAAKMDLNDYNGALQDCDFAINNGVTSAKIFARRSRIQEQLERFDDAVRDMQRAAEQDKQFENELRQLQVRAKRSKRKNYYKVLGLPQNESNQDTIKRAYKKGCLQWHPDKWAHASEEEKTHAEREFKEVGEAFGVLSDPQKKRMYDSGQMDNDVEGANMPQGFGGGNEEEIMHVMNMMFGGGFSGGNFGMRGFGGHHGGGGGRRRPRGGASFYQF